MRTKGETMQGNIKLANSEYEKKLGLERGQDAIDLLRYGMTAGYFDNLPDYKAKVADIIGYEVSKVNAVSS
jgi:hypothetical protein